jgi:hypothetical protein
VFRRRSEEITYRILYQKFRNGRGYYMSTMPVSWKICKFVPGIEFTREAWSSNLAMWTHSIANQFIFLRRSQTFFYWNAVLRTKVFRKNFSLLIIVYVNKDWILSHNLSQSFSNSSSTVFSFRKKSANPKDERYL